MHRFLRYLATLSAALLALHPAGLAAQDGRLGLKTVVIDPGHGGNDPGCVSKDKKTREKDLTLDISRRLAEKIRAEYPGVKVKLTRNNDVFVPLVKRAQIANSANADLFVSIHINSIASSLPNGFSVHVLGQSSKKGRDLYSNNFNECARENSVILLEEDYNTNYQGFDPNDPESSILFTLMQNAYLEQSLMFADNVSRSLARGGMFTSNRGVHQDPFLVLWKTAMPAVLIECGFISNTSDLAVLRDKAKIDAIADCILDAFRSFKADYDRSLSVSAPQGRAETGSPAAPAGASGANPAASPGRNPAEASGSKSSADPAADSRAGSGGDSKTGSVADSRPATGKDSKTGSVTGNGTFYGTQILALRRRLPENAPELKGHRAEVVFDGTIYRYVAGCGDSLDAARREHGKVKADFPGSFLVKVAGGGRVERLPAGR